MSTSSNIDLKKVHSLNRALLIGNLEILDRMLTSCTVEEKTYFFEVPKMVKVLPYKLPILYAASTDNLKLVELLRKHDAKFTVSQNSHNLESLAIIEVLNKHNSFKIFDKYQHAIFSEFQISLKKSSNQTYNQSAYDIEQPKKKKSDFLKHLEKYIEHSEKNFRIDFLTSMFKSLDKTYYMSYHSDIPPRVDCLEETPPEDEFKEWLKGKLIQDNCNISGYIQLINLKDKCWPNSWQNIKFEYIEIYKPNDNNIIISKRDRVFFNKPNMIYAKTNHMVEGILKNIDLKKLFPTLKKLQNGILWKDYLDYLNDTILKVNFQHPELYSYLEKSKFDLYKTDGMGNNFLHYLTDDWQFKHLQSMNFLKKFPELWGQSNNEGKTPLVQLKEICNQEPPKGNKSNYSNVFYYPNDADYFTHDQAKEMLIENIAILEKEVLKYQKNQGQKSQKFGRIML